MKKTLKLIGLILVAGALTFASCDKSEDNTQTDKTTQNDGGDNNGGDNGGNNGGNNGGDNGGGTDTPKVQIIDGALPGVFSVAQNQTVHFSMGNLQYRASTSTWRFAERQWDMVGEGNNNISATYDGWIDLFGWGTSGWDNGAVAYQPYSTSEDAGEYWPGNSPINDLTGDYARADWGVNNAISNGGNQAGMWRTLTIDEWVYLLNTRSASTIGEVTDARWCKAMVDGVPGTIIFPDTYTHPSNMSTPNGINAPDYRPGANSYSIGEWNDMEIAGAVFLPKGDLRTGATYYKEIAGIYWSSTTCGEANAWMVGFYDDNVYIPDNSQRYNGFSVRLVK